MPDNDLIEEGFSSGLLNEDANGLLVEFIPNTLTVSFSGIDNSCWPGCLITHFNPNFTFTIGRSGGGCCTWSYSVPSFTCLGITYSIFITLARTSTGWTLEMFVFDGSTSKLIFLGTITTDDNCITSLSFTNTLHGGGSAGPCCTPDPCFGKDGSGVVTP